MGRPSIDIRYLSGTREIESAVITLERADGSKTRITSTPLRTVYLKAGSGYMPDTEWGHGWYQGELAVQGLTYDMSTAEERLKWLRVAASGVEAQIGEGYCTTSS